MAGQADGANPADCLTEGGAARFAPKAEIRIFSGCGREGRRDVTGNKPIDLEEAIREAHHFFICDGCGQVVDARNAAELLYHDVQGHQPSPEK